MITMVLSHPRAAAVITMAAIAVISFITAYLVLRLSYSRMLSRKINEFTEYALKAKEAEISSLQAEIIEIDAKHNALRSKMAGITVFLSKAVQLSGGNQ